MNNENQNENKFDNSVEAYEMNRRVTELSSDPDFQALMQAEKELLYWQEVEGDMRLSKAHLLKAKREAIANLKVKYTGETKSFIGIEKKHGFRVAAVVLGLAFIAILAIGGALIGRLDGVATATVEAAAATYGEEPSVAVVEPVAVEPEALTPEVVEAKIRAYAAEYGFKWPDYLIRLAKCESGLHADAKNCTNNSPADSCDRGIFQINDYHHSEVPDEVAYDLRKATEWTMWRIESGYQSEWVCDRYI